MTWGNISFIRRAKNRGNGTGVVLRCNNCGNQYTTYSLAGLRMAERAEHAKASANHEVPA